MGQLWGGACYCSAITVTQRQRAGAGERSTHRALKLTGKRGLGARTPYKPRDKESTVYQYQLIFGFMKVKFKRNEERAIAKGARPRQRGLAPSAGAKCQDRALDLD